MHAEHLRYVTSERLLTKYVFFPDRAGVDDSASAISIAYYKY